jgi:hypothetical protein
LKSAIQIESPPAIKKPEVALTRIYNAANGSFSGGKAIPTKARTKDCQPQINNPLGCPIGGDNLSCI